jgi:hypothetical protein
MHNPRAIGAGSPDLAERLAANEMLRRARNDAEVSEALRVLQIVDPVESRAAQAERKEREFSEWQQKRAREIDAENAARRQREDADRRARQHIPNNTNVAALDQRQLKAVCDAIGGCIGDLRKKFRRLLDQRTTRIAELEREVADLKVRHEAVTSSHEVAKEWTAIGEVHYRGEIACYQGSTYQAKRDTGRPPDDLEHWVVLAKCGADGRAMRWRGKYATNAPYMRNDVVEFDGSCYVAIKNGAVGIPSYASSDWNLMARAGQRGKQGATGPRGERGVRGERASTPNISFHVDPERYRAIVFVDGHIGAELPLRDLFARFQLETSFG